MAKKFLISRFFAQPGTITLDDRKWALEQIERLANLTQKVNN